jgi:hypothetical protein
MVADHEGREHSGGVINSVYRPIRMGLKLPPSGPDVRSGAYLPCRALVHGLASTGRMPCAFSSRTREASIEGGRPLFSSPRRLLHPPMYSCTRVACSLRARDFPTPYTRSHSCPTSFLTEARALRSTRRSPLDRHHGRRNQHHRLRRHRQRQTPTAASSFFPCSDDTPPAGRPQSRHQDLP